MVEPLDTKAWVLAPVEPTEEMVDAGGRQQASGRGGPDSIYRAMLSASPSLPVVDGGEVAWARYADDGEPVDVFFDTSRAISLRLLGKDVRALSLKGERDDYAEALRVAGRTIQHNVSRAEAAESRVQSLEEALRAIVERAKAASSGGSLAALSGLSGMEQIARNALKVNGNG